MIGLGSDKKQNHRQNLNISYTADTLLITKTKMIWSFQVTAGFSISAVEKVGGKHFFPNFVSKHLGIFQLNRGAKNASRTISRPIKCIGAKQILAGWSL